ncbi:MAG: TetR/AcrR family transcriptional regulator [Mycobacteriaceae bacterium]|nr:TetR/AcrR family transcriptional regulator [Mycobacteriaceae bacterium]
MTATRDAAATRQRLIDAARAEFGQYGIAGSRVDRIAAKAEANKAQIYNYFGSKEQLFDTVWESVVQQVIESVPIDAADLAGYAERLADTYRRHPEIRRLVSWQRLERGHDGPHRFAVQNTKATVDAIAKAQAEGTVSDHFDPGVLLALIINLASLWTTSSSLEVLTVADVSNPKRQRTIIRDAVECLLSK